ncbi:uncharacterized protein LOC108906789 [Anoplophora glabripennis]|uniref:uncharacterized protein LOC108906789 n=1 Tax=Anoplophora glabripennis TaxID=217634 RepID=UPI00087569DD|nr:uncharacterized protein LOC108906789 [Anoplophora glabripennis]
MHSFSTLVYIAIFSIRCRAIIVRDDDPDTTPKTYTYSDSELARSEVGYTQENYYKPLRREDTRVYQYTSEETNQEADYTQQQADQDPENYPFAQRGHRQQIGRRRIPAKKQYVEQYLKEVPPTTKTVYNQRSGNYLRLNSQPHDRGIKEQTELQRSILKQPSIQYIVQSDLQEKSGTQQQIKYVIPEKPAQLRSSDQQSNSATLTAYQNALLAHQKVLETEGQDETSSRSSIYVSHSIPKKPVRKIVKPTPRDEDAERYTQLQQYEVQQKQPGYEQPSAEVMYQAKLEYPNGGAEFPSPTKLPKYEREKELIRQRLQDLSQYQQIPGGEPLHQEEKIIYQPQQLAIYQQVLSSREGKINEQSQHPEGILEYKTPSRVEEPGPAQYRQPAYAKKGHKYLPEPKTVQYQASVADEAEGKYQQVHIPNQRSEALISFEAAIAKLQSEKLRARQQGLRPQAAYQQEPGTETAGYTLLTGENQDANLPEAGYIRIGDTNRYRSVDNATPVSYRQPQQPANIRYYRRPAISYS